LWVTRKLLRCTNHIFFLAHASANWMFRHKHITSTRKYKWYIVKLKKIKRDIRSRKIYDVTVTFLAHLAFRPCELLSSLFVRRPSVNISHFNLLLRNHWTNCNQTLVEWSLDGPLSKLCSVIPTSNQDGRQTKNRKKGGWNFNCPLLL
jgi:hypothetical protein